MASDAAGASYSYHLDPADSTYHVTLEPGNGALADALKHQLGELVTVESGAVTRLDRTYDTPRHWGGSGIGPYGYRLSDAGQRHMCERLCTIRTVHFGALHAVRRAQTTINPTTAANDW